MNSPSFRTASKERFKSFRFGHITTKLENSSQYATLCSKAQVAFPKLSIGKTVTIQSTNGMLSLCFKRSKFYTTLSLLCSRNFSYGHFSVLHFSYGLLVRSQLCENVIRRPSSTKCLPSRIQLAKRCRSSITRQKCSATSSSCSWKLHGFLLMLELDTFENLFSHFSLQDWI